MPPETTAAVESPVQAPPDQSQTAQPAHAAQATKPDPPVSDAVNPNEAYLIPTPTGERAVTLRELVDRFNSTPEISESELSQLRTVRDAIAGNPEAIQSIMGLPAKPAAPAQPQTEADKLSARLKDMEDRLNRVVPVAEQIEAFREEAVINETIKAYSDRVPLLSKHPNANQLLRQRLIEAHREAEQGASPLFPGVRIDVNRLDQGGKQKLLARAMAQAEYQIQQFLNAYGVSPAAAPARAAQPTEVVVDDQGDPNRPRMREAHYKVGPNGMELAGGKRILQTPAGLMVEIASDIPASAPTGGLALDAGAPHATRGPVDEQGMHDRLRRRVEEWNNQP